MVIQESINQVPVLQELNIRYRNGLKDSNNTTNIQYIFLFSVMSEHIQLIFLNKKTKIMCHTVY